MLTHSSQRGADGRWDEAALDHDPGGSEGLAASAFQIPPPQKYGPNVPAQVKGQT